MCYGVSFNVVPEFSTVNFGIREKKRKSLDRLVPEFFGVCAGVILELWETL